MPCVHAKRWATLMRSKTTSSPCWHKRAREEAEREVDPAPPGEGEREGAMVRGQGGDIGNGKPPGLHRLFACCHRGGLARNALTMIRAGRTGQQEQARGQGGRGRAVVPQQQWLTRRRITRPDFGTCDPQCGSHPHLGAMWSDSEILDGRLRRSLQTR